MNRGRRPPSTPMRGAASAFLLLACCGGGNSPPKPKTIAEIIKEDPGSPPCSLSTNTKFAEPEKLIKFLGTLTPQPGSTESDLEGHCNAVWQEAVDGYYCGEVAVPAFCNTCTNETEKLRCSEGNGHGLAMEKCYEASSAPFAANFPTCNDFAWCDRQLKTGCK